MIDSRLNHLEERVSTIESTIESLRSSYEQGKIIRTVTPIENGYKVVFSDNQQIFIYNGEKGEKGDDGINGVDGITPMLLVDQDGYWNVSYDGGVTYSRLQDNIGENIKGIGQEGISIKVTTDEDGYYTFTQYLASNPDSIISIIETPLSSDSSKIISSIIEDSKSHIITLTMQNGESFTFNKEICIPSSIALLNTSPLFISKEDTVSFEFRVNPSIATFNYNIDSDSCEIFLDRIGETKSYITIPTNYSLVKVEQVYNEVGVMKTGQYRAYIVDLNKNEMYNDDIALVLGTTNRNGDYFEISSSSFRIKYTNNILFEFSFSKELNPKSVICDVTGEIAGSHIKIMSPYITNPSDLIPSFRSNGHRVLVNGIEQESGITHNDFSKPLTYRVFNNNGEFNEYTIEVIHSGLPIIFIDTPNNTAITTKETWVENAKIKIVGIDGKILHDGTTSIKGRGNSTWWKFPKKPYLLKLDKKAEILGMPEHKRWVLLANWIDRTLMRNRLAFKLSECTEISYTPRCEYVELVLNGKHVGNYLLTEQIRIDKNRLNIHELSELDEDISGGYLMELDKYYDEFYKFRSEVMDFPYMFKKPDENKLTEAMFSYMKSYINRMENLLYHDFENYEWRDYINMESFADYWFAAELTSNYECRHPQSVYMYKERGEKLCIGPIWDNDYWTFIPENSSCYALKNYLYYPSLFTDSTFVAIVKERWPTAKKHFYTVTEFIDNEAKKIESSDKINISMWPISIRVNNDETLSFKDAVNRMKSAFIDKLNWLDNEISLM